MRGREGVVRRRWAASGERGEVVLRVTAESICSYALPAAKCHAQLRIPARRRRWPCPLLTSNLQHAPQPSSPRNPTNPPDGRVLACSAPSPRLRQRSQKPASALQSADRKLRRPQQRQTRKSGRPRPSTPPTRPLRVGRRTRTRQTAPRSRLQRLRPHQRSRSSRTSTWAQTRTTWCCSSVRASAALSLFSPVPALRGLSCAELTSSHVSSAASMLTKLIAHNDQVPLSTCVFCHSLGSCGWLVLTMRVPPSFPDPDRDDLTRFHSRTPPGISVVEYLRRIVRYTNIEVRPPAACAMEVVCPRS